MGILERIQSIRWSETRQCLDLACGTGRTGSWLAAKGVAQIDGVDLTPEMLALGDELTQRSAWAAAPMIGACPDG